MNTSVHYTFVLCAAELFVCDETAMRNYTIICFANMV